MEGEMAGRTLCIHTSVLPLLALSKSLALLGARVLKALAELLSYCEMALPQKSRAFLSLSFPTCNMQSQGLTWAREPHWVQ